MLRSLYYGSILTALLALAAAVPANSLTIDFEEFSHGDIVAAPTGSGAGYTIGVENFSKAFDAAVAFDTNGTGTVANDLRRASSSGWASGNLSRDLPSIPHSGEDLGNILIIQANDACSATVCSTPHDEGRRPAGLFTVRLTGTLANGFAFDLVDVDDLTRENGSITFHMLGAGEDPSSGSAVSSYTFAEFEALGQDVVFGNNSANHLVLDTLGLYNAIEIRLAGSGGIDNLDFQNTRPIPEPASALLVSLGVGALALSRRRRSG